MADVKISDLPAASTLDGTEPFPLVQGAATKKGLGSQVLTYILANLTKSSVGLGNVDNTSDANKPVSSAAQTALNLKFDTSGLGTNVATFLGTPSSANLRAALTDEVGTGAAYFVGGALSTPASGTLSSCTGYPTAQLTGAGTGVLTALAVNIGSAGAVLAFNGALGTPSSGTLTNCSGLPAANIVAGTMASGMVLVAPALGTPASGNLSNCTALPAANITAGTMASGMTLVAPLLGTPASGALTNCTADGTNAVGFRQIPQNSQSAAYTTVLADGGKHLYHPSADTTARIWTIDSNANVAYPIGTALTFVNDTSGGVITIAITSDTLVLAGAGTTGSRTLAANGVATAIKMTSTRWMISGTGLT